MSVTTPSPPRPIPSVPSLSTTHATMKRTTTSTSISSPTTASPTSPSRPSRFIEETILTQPWRSRFSHQQSNTGSSSSLSMDSDHYLGDASDSTPPLLRDILLEMDEFERRRRSRSGSGSERMSGEQSGADSSAGVGADRMIPRTSTMPDAHRSGDSRAIKSRRDSDSSGKKVASRLRGRLRALTVGRA